MKKKSKKILKFDIISINNLSLSRPLIVYPYIYTINKFYNKNLAIELYEEVFVLIVQCLYMQTSPFRGEMPTTTKFKPFDDRD